MQDAEIRESTLKNSLVVHVRILAWQSVQVGLVRIFIAGGVRSSGCSQALTHTHRSRTLRTLLLQIGKHSCWLGCVQ